MAMTSRTPSLTHEIAVDASIDARFHWSNFFDRQRRGERRVLRKRKLFGDHGALVKQTFVKTPLGARSPRRLNARAHQANLARATSFRRDWSSNAFEDQRNEPGVAKPTPDRPIVAFVYFSLPRVEGIEENEPTRLSKTK